MKTKIIATIGPSTLNFKNFKGIIDEGVDFIRINTAYSDTKQHKAIYKNIEKIKTRKKIGIIYDIRNKDAVPRLDFFKDFVIAVSFAESAEQLKEIKKLSSNKKLIAKIESEKGLEKFDEILKNSWGVMVARGDLGLAVSLERVPCAQKSLSQKILKDKKFLVIATEMLLSMTNNPNPTRAEVSDVANAVFDGASAVMLSEETAVGKYPVEAVNYMKRIIKATEDCIEKRKLQTKLG